MTELLFHARVRRLNPIIAQHYASCIGLAEYLDADWRFADVLYSSELVIKFSDDTCAYTSLLSGDAYFLLD
jgi:hypothetical protein